METKRAEWLLKEFPINSWLSDANKILNIGSGMGYVDNKLKMLMNSNIYGFDIIDFRTRFVKQIYIRFSFYQSNNVELCKLGTPTAQLGVIKPNDKI